MSENDFLYHLLSPFKEWKYKPKLLKVAKEFEDDYTSDAMFTFFSDDVLRQPAQHPSYRYVGFPRQIAITTSIKYEDVDWQELNNLLGWKVIDE